MKQLACGLLVVIISASGYADPYNWEKIKVKIGKGRYLTVRLDYGLFK